MLIRDARYRVIDTETTDKDPARAKLVEIAYRDVDFLGTVLGSSQALVNPGIPIPPTASAVHHLIDEDVADALPAETILVMVRSMALAAADCHVAHNAEYDSQVLRLSDVPWLCTHRLAKHLWPEIDNHSNQVIRYTLKLKPDLAPDEPAHRAANDVAVTAEILRTALPLVFRKWPGISTIAELIEKVKAPCQILRIPFAGHGYPLFTDAEEGLLRWIINKQAGGEDCVYSACRELERREEEDAAAEVGFGLVGGEDENEAPLTRDERTGDLFERPF